MAFIKMILTNAFNPDIRVFKEAQYLVSQDNEVEILCWDREREFIDKQTDIIEGIHVTRFFIDSKYGTGAKQLNAYKKFSEECKAYLKEKDCDFLHCHDLDGALIGCKCLTKKRKLIFDMHEYYLGSKNKVIEFIKMRFLKLCWRKAYKIVYVNDFQLSYLPLKYSSKKIFLPNYPVLSYYEPIMKDGNDKVRINYIGGVRQSKELKLLIDVVAKEKRASVYIRGRGTSYQDIKNYSQGIENVQVEGGYNGLTDSGYLFRNTDVLYCVYDKNNKNNSNAFAVKFFEAIVTNTPVIVSKSSKMSELVKEHDIGYIVEDDSFISLKNIIEFIVNNQEIYNEKICNIKKISSNYTWEKTISNLNYFENIL